MLHASPIRTWTRPEGRSVPTRKPAKSTERLPRPAPRRTEALPKTLEECSDFDLLQLFVKSDHHEAMETLWRRHKRQVYNFIYKMVGKAEPAEDIFQETFMRVLKNAGSYTPRAKSTTWALQIARNLTLDHYKRENLRQHASIDATTGGDEGEQTFASLLQGQDPQSVDILQQRELVEEVRVGITTLPENQREALILRVHQDMPYADIAQVLGSPEGTVKYWVHEAIAALSKYLQKRGLV
jgi:RNA polymerase sigma-70 factor (ECF subfamily)